MARLILKSPYIKSTGGASGYLRYIATRLRIRSGKWIRNVTVQTSPMPPEEEAQRAAGME